MKFHKIELRNINSLYGHQVVDLDRDLKSASLFLIVGPTGAGKSTLMDAVSLALFGQTPRLSPKKGRPDLDARLVMSQGTADCMAAVEFSKVEADGVRRRYRAEWSCQRAYQKVEGKLQEPRRCLYSLDEETGQVPLIEDDRAKFFQPVFDDVLEHFKVEDFQRCVLLAQGEFAAFLKASEDERAGILERLTDTTVYQDIGRVVSRIRKDREDKLTRLQAQVDGHEMLSPEEIAGLEQALEVTCRDLQARELEFKKASSHFQWLKGYSDLKKQLEEAGETLTRAQEKTERLEPERQRLEEDRRCRPAQAQNQAANAAGQELARIETQLPGLQNEVDQRHSAKEQAENEEGAARSANEEREGALERARPATQEARSKREIWQQAWAAANDARKRTGAAAQLKETREKELAGSRKTFDDAAKEAEEAFALVDSLRSAEPLVEELAGLKARLDQVAARGRELTDTQTAIEAVDKEDAKLARQEKTAIARLEAATEKTALQDKKVAGLQEMLESKLDGASSSRARREELQEVIEGLTGRATALEQAAQGLEALKNATVTLTELKHKHADEASTSVDLENRQASLSARASEASNRFDLLDQSRQDLALALKLSQERANLREGTPCPLCGSLEHPHRISGSLEDLDRQLNARSKKVSKETAEAKRSLQVLQSDLNEANRALGAARGAQVERERSISEASKTLEAVHKRFVEQLRRALPEGIGDPVQWGLDARAVVDVPETGARWEQLGTRLISARADVENELARSRKASKELEDVEEQLKTAQKGLREDDEAMAGAEKARTEVAGKRAEIRVRREDLSKRLEQGVQALETSVTELGQRCARLGLDAQSPGFPAAGVDGGARALPATEVEGRARALPAAGVDGGAREEPSTPIERLAALARTSVPQLRKVLEEAERRVTKWKLANQRGEAARTALQTAESNLTTCKQRLADAEEALTQDSAERDRLAGIEQETEKVARACLEGRDPDAVEKDLEGACREARDKLEQAARRASEARSGLAEAVARLDERRQQRAQRLEQAEAAQQSLRSALEALGLPDVEALEATLMVEKEREALERELKQADETLGQARAILEDKEARLTGLETERPEDLETEKTDLASLEAEINRLDGERRELLARKSRDEGRLEEQAQKRKRLAELLERLKDRRREYNTWKHLHDLVGVGDGKHFKRYAQILNLQDLIEKANARLKWLAPRYSLAIAYDDKGEHRLAFAIRDEHYAGHERPLSTLSGGEVFQVSLALALALSDYRRVRMPIETLLLDEGFGTLDTDTLNAAMDALSRLLDRQTQVGIISHVEGLRERIDAQIIVEKLGNGRSRLTFSERGV